MGPLYQSPSEEESGNDKNILPTSPQQQLLMKSLWKTLKKCFIKCFKITIQNQTVEATINPHLLHKDMVQMVYPSLTSGLMESHQIFGTTANISNVRRKATNQMQLTKIRWEEALNVAKSAINESKRERQVQITTQLNKLKYRY